MRELVIPAKREFDCDAKALDGHDGDRTDEGAYGDINDWIRAAIARCDGVYHDEGEDENAEAIHEESWRAK